MIFSNLDSIVRRGLLDNNLPIHWYFEFLNHGASCLRELNIDVLKVINAANLPVSTYGTADLPDDFQDDIAVSLPIGQSLQRLPKQDWITPLRLHDKTTGAFVPYENDADTDSDNDNDDNTFFGFPAAWGWFWNVNDYGEPTGRFYGSPGGTELGYQIFKERRQIQLTNNFTDGSVVLLYVSDGQSIDSASQVDTKAFATIRSYTEWKRDPQQANDENSPKARSFYNQRRRLISRLSDLTLVDVRNVIRQNYIATIKN